VSISVTMQLESGSEMNVLPYLISDINISRKQEDDIGIQILDNLSLDFCDTNRHINNNFYYYRERIYVNVKRGSELIFRGSTSRKSYTRHKDIISDQFINDVSLLRNTIVGISQSYYPIASYIKTVCGKYGILAKFDRVDWEDSHGHTFNDMYVAPGYFTSVVIGVYESRKPGYTALDFINEICLVFALSFNLTYENNQSIMSFVSKYSDYSDVISIPAVDILDIHESDEMPRKIIIRSDKNEEEIGEGDETIEIDKEIINYIWGRDSSTQYSRDDADFVKHILKAYTPYTVRRKRLRLISIGDFACNSIIQIPHYPFKKYYVIDNDLTIRKGGVEISDMEVVEL